MRKSSILVPGLRLTPLVLLLIPLSSSFTPPVRLRSQWLGSRRFELVVTTKTRTGNQDDDSVMATMRFRRVGGRRKKQHESSPMQKKRNVPWWWIGLAFLCLWLSFGGGDSSNFYYFESSTYTQTVVGADGKVVETVRKENTRTNINMGLPRDESSSMMLRSLDNYLDRLLESDGF